MVNSAQLVELAARAIPSALIAKALGLTESRISQLLSEQRVAQAVELRTAELATKSLDEIIDLESVNAQLLSRIGDLAEETESLAEATMAYEKLSKMQAQKQGHGQLQDEGIREITLQIPTFLQHRISLEISPRGEIIELDNRSMATMPTTAVHKLIREAKALPKLETIQEAKTHDEHHKDFCTREASELSAQPASF